MRQRIIGCPVVRCAPKPDGGLGRQRAKADKRCHFGRAINWCNVPSRNTGGRRTRVKVIPPLSSPASCARPSSIQISFLRYTPFRRKTTLRRLACDRTRLFSHWRRSVLPRQCWRYCSRAPHKSERPLLPRSSLRRLKCLIPPSGPSAISSVISRPNGYAATLIWRGGRGISRMKSRISSSAN